MLSAFRFSPNTDAKQVLVLLPLHLPFGSAKSLMSNICLHLCYDFLLWLHLPCSFLSISQSLVKLLTSPLWKLEGLLPWQPVYRCLPPASGNWCLMASHLAWTVQSCSLGCFLPDAVHPNHSSPQWSGFCLSSGETFLVAEQKVETSSTREGYLSLYRALLSLLPMPLSSVKA